MAGTFKTDIRRPGNPSEDFGAVTINVANGSAGDSQIVIQNLSFPDPAAANATYDVRFCPMVPGQNTGCVHVTTVSTDANGTGSSTFTYPQNGASAGVFFLARNNGDEFESMFQEDSGASFYNAKLQPFSAIGFGNSAQFGTPGNDPLTDGSVVHHDFTVFTVSVTGAMASSTYAISFCPFGGGSGSCISLGSLATDASGNGTADVQFPSNTGGPFRAGAVALSRGGTYEFLSGFFVQH